MTEDGRGQIILLAFALTCISVSRVSYTQIVHRTHLVLGHFGGAWDVESVYFEKGYSGNTVVQVQE